MRKVFANKWFILAIVLTTFLSTFSFVTFGKARTQAEECYKPCNSGDKTRFFLEFITHQVSVSTY